MNILTIDIGGTHVKLLRTGMQKKRSFNSGPNMTPEEMMRQIDLVKGDWDWDRVSIGFPAPCAKNRPLKEPAHLKDGWMDFDYEKALGSEVRLINDAAMQAFGSYQGGKMLFLGLGTGLGTALIDDDHLVPLELGHLNYKGKKTVEDFVGEAYLVKKGLKKWLGHVLNIIEMFRETILPEYIVLGGGNTNRISDLPEGVQRGSNHNAFLGGFRLWDKNAQMSLTEKDEQSQAGIT
jgi:polyphosphate glucokinase